MAIKFLWFLALLLALIGLLQPSLLRFVPEDAQYLLIEARSVAELAVLLSILKCLRERADRCEPC